MMTRMGRDVELGLTAVSRQPSEIRKSRFLTAEAVRNDNGLVVAA
jgi:hypothetical protein